MECSKCFSGSWDQSRFEPFLRGHRWGHHIHKNRELFDALTLGSATRNEPLTLVISTAGFDLDSPLGEIYRYGRKIESGEVEDPSFGFKWFGPKDHETFDHSDPKTWRKYNPAFDHFMNQDEMEVSIQQNTRISFHQIST